MDTVQKKIAAVYDRVERDLQDKKRFSLSADDLERQLRTARRFITQVWPVLPSIPILSALDITDLYPVEAIGNDTSVWLDNQGIDGSIGYRSGAQSFYASRTWNTDGSNPPSSDGVIIRLAKDRNFTGNEDHFPSLLNSFIKRRGSSMMQPIKVPTISLNTELMRLVQNRVPPLGGSIGPNWYVFAWFSGSAEEKCGKVFVLSGLALQAAVFKILNSFKEELVSALEFFEKLLKNTKENKYKFVARKSDFIKIINQFKGEGISTYQISESDSDHTTYFLCISYERLEQELRDQPLALEMGFWRQPPTLINPISLDEASDQSTDIAAAPTSPNLLVNSTALRLPKLTFGKLPPPPRKNK